MEPQYFKLEDSKTVIKLISKNCFLASLDVMNAYHLFGVNKEDRKYLRFKFNKQLFEYNCIPFGLCKAPFVFTKLTKPILHLLRKAGFLSVVYLDDFLLIGNSFNECRNNLNKTIYILESLGFLINKDKSQLTPAQNCKFLGLEFDSINMRILLPYEKRKNLLELIEKFLKMHNCKIRVFAEFIGKLVAASIACKICSIHIKKFETEKFLALKNVNDNYDKEMIINPVLNEDLLWWKKNILITYNPIRIQNFQLEIHSDSSITGWRVYCRLGKTHGFWNES